MTGPATKSDLPRPSAPCPLAPRRRHASALACCMLLFLVSFPISRIPVNLDVATVSRNETDGAVGRASVDAATASRNETAAAIGKGETTVVATASRNETADAASEGEKIVVTSEKAHAGGREAGTCRRPCPHYDNRIIIRSKQMAGLKDRTYIMRAWANMAMFLCARVQVPSPPTWLNPKHGSVDTNVTFERDLLFFADADNPAEVVASDLIDSGDPRGGGPWGLDLTTELRRAKRRGGLVDDLFRVYNYTARQQREGLPRFRWTVAGTFMFYSPGMFRAMAQLRSDLAVGAAPISVPPGQLPKWERYKDSVGCVYASKVEAAGIRATARRALRRLRDRFGVGEGEPFSFGYLHVRRGDSKKDRPDAKSRQKCYTELPRMKEYLECTFRSFCREGATERHCRGDVPLLVGSDERDRGYREGLLSLVDGLGRPLAAVDLDRLVSDEIEREIAAGESDPRKRNNFSVFLVGMVIIQEASFYLRQDRRLCNDCDADRVDIGRGEDRWWRSWLAVDLHTKSCWAHQDDGC